MDLIAITVLVLQASVGALITAIPLVGDLGFERALVAGVIGAATVPLLGWARSAGRSVLVGYGQAVVLGWAATLPSIGFGLLREAATTTCNTESGLAFFVLLPGAGAVYGAATGVWLRRLFGDRGWLGIVAVAVLHLVVIGAKLYAYPQIWVFDLLWGYWPGSLYDEALTIGSALVAQRALTVVVGLALAFSAATVFDRSHRATTAALSLVGVIVSVWLASSRFELGFGTGYSAIERELSVKVETPHFVVYLPSGTSADLAARVAREHEFQFDQLTDLFEPATDGIRIHSYLYANPAQKGRLMGAFGTKIARPWAKEIHMHGVTDEPPSLAHELAHVLAAAWVDNPLGVPVRGGFQIQIGLVEGLAVAAEPPAGGLTVHERARALAELSLLPDVVGILSWSGFWKHASGRAYTAAGSFVAFIRERYGSPAVRRLYATASVASALGRSTPEVVEEWHRFLSELTLPPQAITWAEERYRRPAIFARTCPREVGRLTERGRRALAEDRWSDAVIDLEAAYRLMPDPSRLLELAAQGARRGHLEAAESWLNQVVSSTLTAAQARSAMELRGSLAWRSGDLATARGMYRRALKRATTYDEERLSAARLEAATRTATVAVPLLAYLDGQWSGERAVIELSQLERDAGDGLVSYLLARRFASTGATRLALSRVRQALSDARLPRALVPEARWMLVRYLRDSGRPRAALAAVRELLDEPGRPAVRHRADEEHRRIEHILRWPNPEDSAKTPEDS